MGTGQLSSDRIGTGRLLRREECHDCQRINASKPRHASLALRGPPWATSLYFLAGGISQGFDHELFPIQVRVEGVLEQLSGQAATNMARLKRSRQIGMRSLCLIDFRISHRI